MAGPFARIVANFLVMGTGVLVRAAAQAYRQAIINGSKAGMAAEGAAGAAGARAARAGSAMSLEEAQLVLGVEANTSWDTVLKRYKHMMEANSQVGSFYLQSKVHRAMERIGQEMGQDTGGVGGAGPAGGSDAPPAGGDGAAPPGGAAGGAGGSSVNFSALPRDDAPRWGGFAASGVRR